MAQKRLSIRVLFIIVGLIISLTLPSLIGWLVLSKFSSFSSNAMNFQVNATVGVLERDLKSWFQLEAPVNTLAEKLSDISLQDATHAKKLIMTYASQINDNILSQWGNVISSDANLKRLETQLPHLCAISTEEECTQMRKFYNTYASLRQAYMLLKNNVKFLYAGTEDGYIFEASMFWVPEPGSYDPRVRPWYTTAKAANGKVVYTEPYVEFTSGAIVVTVSKAYKINGKIAGVIAVDFKLDTLSHMMQGALIKKGDKILAMK